jgi:hypothetical protein
MPVGGCRHSQAGAGDPSTSLSRRPRNIERSFTKLSFPIPVAVSRTTRWYDGFRYSLFGG